MKKKDSHSNFIPANIKELDLSNQDVGNFDVQIPKDNKVQNMNLTRTFLKNLPMPMPNIRSLNMSANNLEKLEPEIIFALQSYSKMDSLDLSVNQLKEIPIEFKKFKNLETLSLFYNQITYDECKEIDIPSLKHVDLSQNRFTRLPVLPSGLKSLTFDFNLLRNLENVKMSHLVKLSLALTELEYIDSEIVFPKLEILDLSKNKLYDLPDLLKMAPKLQIIDVSNNFLGEMPKMPKTIREITIKNNNLTTLPDDLQKLTNLVQLDISHNHVEHIPALPESIESFIFSKNIVTSVTPCKTPKLQRLYLRFNKLTQYPQYERLKIREFSASSNLITDLRNINFCDNLIRIDFSNNGLTEVPPSIFHFNKLQILILSNNNIKAIPDDISKSKSLMTLQLTSNPLTSLPTNLPQSLINIYIGYCQLESLPEMSQMKNLAILCAPGNKLTKIPHLPNSVKSLWLARNHLSSFPSGSIPKNVEQLDLSYNQIKSIPANIFFSHLEEFDLTHNELTTFPIDFKLPSLRFLRLGNNPLNCELPGKPFDGLEIADITETNLVFKTEPSIRQFFVSELLPQYESRHVKQMSALPWLQFSEMKGVRGKMEDSLAVNAFINGDMDLYTILDGHGGNKTSAFASLFLVDELILPGVKLTKKYIYRLIKKLNYCLRTRNYTDGATMATIAFNGKKLVSAHVGDARTLVVDKSGKVTFATRDHKPTDRKEFERIHLEGGRVSGNRIHGILAPGRSLGDFIVPGNCDEPEVNAYMISQSDKWIISGCDGVFDVLSNEKIAEVAANASSAGELATDLKNMAYSNYSTDNISVIVVDIEKRVAPQNVKHICDSCEDDNLPKMKIHFSFDEAELSYYPELTSETSTESMLRKASSAPPSRNMKNMKFEEMSQQSSSSALSESSNMTTDT